jgi:GNAT superfamily N-acetyltransferase
LIFEPLDPSYHNTHSFTCGNAHLDAILQAGATGYGKTYVVVSRTGSRRIIAYLSLLPEPQDIVKPHIGTEPWTYVLLNALAVDLRYQRRGIGRWILSELIIELAEFSKTVTLDYLVIAPLDDEARAYYQHLGWQFDSLENGNLILSISAIRKAVGSAGRKNLRMMH